MAKVAKAGEMRTRIHVQEPIRGIDADGYQTVHWRDVFCERIWCKWLNPHGTEIYENMRLNLREPATITMRYTDKMHSHCRIFKDYVPVGDETVDGPHAYEIISMDNLFDERRLLEIKVQRKGVA